MERRYDNPAAFFLNRKTLQRLGLRRLHLEFQPTNPENQAGYIRTRKRNFAGDFVKSDIEPELPTDQPQGADNGQEQNEPGYSEDTDLELQEELARSREILKKQSGTE